MEIDDKKSCFRQGYIKEFKYEIYLANINKNTTYYYNTHNHYRQLTSIILFPNGRELFNDSEIISLDDEGIENYINNFISKWNNIIFTEDEIIKSPCPTMEDYQNKLDYLKYKYIKQVNYKRANWKEFNNYKLFDPISYCFVSIDDKEFVDHHIWLCAQLKKSLRPTVFPVSYYGTEVEKFLTYYYCLPFAEEDDPMLSEAKEYIKNHARNVVKKIYKDTHNSDIPLQLITDGYIKKPTLRKLLEMANYNFDSQFSAIILEELKESQVSKNRFSL